MSPRPTSLISGATSWLTETCAKPSSRAMSASRASCSVNLQPCISTMASASIPLCAHARASATRACVFVQRRNDLAVRADPLVDLDDRSYELLGQHDVPREDLGPRLVADAQRVAEARA